MDALSSALNKFRILIAPDKFKGALSAKEVCLAIQEGLQSAHQHFETILFPLADGGEGTAEVLTFNTEGRMRTLTVNDPLFRKTKAQYGISGDGTTAFIEMAQASGLSLLHVQEQNCLKTSTYGTGEIIKDALTRGVKKIVLGIGGSATNDAGIGMAAALGFGFFDSTGRTLLPTGENLLNIASIESADVTPLLKNVEVLIACDVENPLYGPEGAAYVYAPQKGADQRAVEVLDKGLRHFAQVVQKKFNLSLQDIKGAGAAGGLGAGAVVFLGGKLKRGLKLILDITCFHEVLKEVDLVITGEGKIDRQTLSGKLVKGITDTAKVHGIPTIALCGALDLDQESLKKLGTVFTTSIVTRPCSKEEAIAESYSNLKQTAFNLGKLIHTFRSTTFE